MTKYSTRGNRYDGGQKRTIHGVCGFSLSGQATEAVRRFKVHARQCDICSKQDTDIPEFNSTLGRLNGYNGVRPNLSVVDKMHSGAIMSNEPRVVVHRRNQNLEEMNQILDNLSLDESTEVIEVKDPETIAFLDWFFESNTE
jgi:hypothetical protein